MIVSAICASAAYADDHGHGHEGGNDNDQGHDRPQVVHNATINIRIENDERSIVHDYYGGEISRGRCPPGLAKKQNGCLPPGHARQWVVGRPLPREVVYYDLPPQLIVQLHPPHGARYVRAGSDILLIAIGTGVVLDALQDFGYF
ncbi:MAG TPA: RcnB family protein [Alphaproteobacteria bacterium]|jgi:hypothetical protein